LRHNNLAIEMRVKFSTRFLKLSSELGYRKLSEMVGTITEFKPIGKYVLAHVLWEHDNEATSHLVTNLVEV